MNWLKTLIQLWVARYTSPCDLYITTLAACYLDMVVQKRIVLEIYVHTTVLVCIFFVQNVQRTVTHMQLYKCLLEKSATPLDYLKFLTLMRHIFKLPSIFDTNYCIVAIFRSYLDVRKDSKGFLSRTQSNLIALFNRPG